MSDKFSIDYNTAEIRKLLKALPENLQERVVRNALTAGARKFAKAAAEAAPFDAQSSGKHMRDQIKVSWDRKNKEVSVGIKSKDALYAHMVEFGTVKKSPNPFFRQSYKTEFNNLINIIFTNMANGIRKQAEKFKRG